MAIKTSHRNCRSLFPCSKSGMILLALAVLTSLAASSAGLTIRFVTDRGEPLDNVFIVLNDRLFVSDEQGFFIIPSEAWSNDNLLLVLHRTGYKGTEVLVSGLEEGQKIVLKRESISVFGVTVTSEREYLGDRTVLQITPEMRGKTLPDIIGSYGEISGLSLPGERQTVSLGGHSAKHLMVLVDGIPLNKMGQPVDISSIPLSIIESVEIIRGGSSAAGGGGAMAGAINIRTVSGRAGNEYYMTQSIGSFEYKKSGVGVSGTYQKVWFDFYADAGYAKNDYPYLNRHNQEVTREYNDKAFQNFYLKTVYRLTNAVLTHKLDFHRFQNKMPGPVNYSQLYRDARLDGYGLNTDLQYQRIFDKMSLAALVYYHQDETEYDNRRSPHPFYRILGQHFDRKRGARISSSYDYDLYFQPPVTAVDSLTAQLNKQGSYAVRCNTETAIEYNREDFRYDEPTNVRNSIPLIYSENFAFRGEIGLSLPVLRGSRKNNKLISNPLGEWHHHALFRYDKTNLWQDNHSRRYVTSFRFDYPDILIGYSGSSNFSLPSFYDLYWKGDCQASGNPNLLPEVSQNRRIFTEFNRLGIAITASYEKSEVDNLIYWFRSVTGWKPGNIAAAAISEYNLGIDVKSFEYAAFTASYSNIRALNQTLQADGSESDFFGKYLPYRPEARAFGEIRSGEQLPLLLKLRHTFTGEQHTTLDQLIAPLPAYHLTDFEVAYNLQLSSVNCLLSLNLNNLFNNRYEIYPYTPMPGFNWMLNLSLGYTKD